MKHQEENKQLQSESQSTVKAYFKNILSDYFLFNPKFDKSINYSRIYNTVLWIFEILLIIMQFVIFNYTKSTHIGNKKLQFQIYFNIYTT